MNLWVFCILLQVMVPPPADKSAQRIDQPSQPASSPKVLVRSLYTRVVGRHPIGIPDDEQMKIFEPYLSKALLHRIDLAVACGADWQRQHPEPHLKPALAWMELGPFAGDNERATPKSFVIEREETEKDGSFRVYVKLTRPFPGEPLSNWHVAAVVVREGGHFVVDEVIYLKDKELNLEDRLSNYLFAGCDGPHWVGFSNQQNGPKQEK